MGVAPVQEFAVQGLGFYFFTVQSFVMILGEKDCFVTFIDDRTRLSWVYWDEELHDHLQLSFESTN